MHFHLSANAAQDLKIKDFAPTAGGDAPPVQHWYVHRVIVQRRKQVIVMEAQSRYALVFCGVTKPFFDDFADIFADTLWRHIVSLCEVPDAQWGRVKAMTTAMCAMPCYHKGAEQKSASTHQGCGHADGMAYGVWRAAASYYRPRPTF